MERGDLDSLVSLESLFSDQDRSVRKSLGRHSGHRSGASLNQVDQTEVIKGIYT
jgi:hypothetical protein